MKKSYFNKDNVYSENLKYLSSIWSEKIDNFYVLCIYDEGNFNNPRYRLFNNNISIVEGSKSSNTFIIWEQSYQKNKDLFFKLRVASRNELMKQIAKYIVNYLLKEYESYSSAPIESHQILNKKSYISKLIEKFEIILKRDTFLVNHRVWEDFCKWFKAYLINWVLEDIQESIGIPTMNTLNEKQLNELFYHYITKNFTENNDFTVKFTNIIDDYVQKWVEKIIASLKLKNISIDKIIQLLELTEDPITIKGNNYQKDIYYTLIKDGCIRVMSNAPYQTVREALSLNRFQHNPSLPWPSAVLHNGVIDGVVQIKPIRFQKKAKNSDVPKVVSLKQIERLFELAVDVYDALCSFYLSRAQHHSDIVEIRIDDLLALRGLKPKLGGSGRRGGYESEQRKNILEALSVIQKLWISLEKATVYEKGKPVQLKLEGSAFKFLDDRNKEQFIDRKLRVQTIRFTVGEVFEKYLYGTGRQIALLPIQTLQYNVYRKKWEKKLIRYLSWRWRTQARKGEYLQPHKISTLLSAIGEKVNERIPSRSRDRLEQAFDALLEGEVIASWQYEQWNESIASNKGWSRIWLNSTVIIEPPDAIKKHYISITKQRGKSNKFTINPKYSKSIDDERNIGKELKVIRKDQKLTISQLAEELEISAAYLSTIERGINIPSKRVETRIIRWMYSYEIKK
ncbi:hypothetical protein M948_17150 [Virgibacillus sp. CM-4]|uniref:helix-turn-helix domain-containing protein n=1 Tax=Virgibacillus sp. CM-4 TaxID=1354277 RepID=UPI0003887597|nr:helix-turn-helix transcriptional regulator [Virgibacillus sp. CM-4]EQB36761.1 hypothetical protein M948_17150 [Virgibacillus sp. CM-4]